MSNNIEPLRVCIDARLLSGELGGVEQFVIGLAHGLSQMDDGDDKMPLQEHEGADAEEENDLYEAEEEVDFWQLAEDIFTGEETDTQVLFALAYLG